MLRKTTFNAFSVLGIIYITIMVTLAWDSVGETNSCGDPFEWYLPLFMFFVVFFPFLLGGLAERAKYE